MCFLLRRNITTILVIDTENDTYNKGSPFDQRFNPVCIGTFDGKEKRVYWERPTIKDDFFVGFNIKYDLHVLRKWGVALPKRIWCCQVAEYLLERQSNPYPSLERTAEKYGLGRKLDKVKEFWEKGVQTSEIPREILSEYVLQDVELTYQIYLKQQQQIKSHQATLFRLAMLDLLCLEEIEWNGMKYDTLGIKNKSEQIQTEISQIKSNLNLFHSVPSFNWNSSAHIAALLFGGTITETVKVPCGYYKTGAKAGEVKYQNEVREHHLPQLYKSTRKTETGKQATDEDALSELGNSDLIKGILKIKELEKLNSTYFLGMLELAEKANFEPDYLHANFNQVVTRTGRLSSSKPNLQNKPEALDEFIVTRFT